jgi:hypothetical protein
MHQNSGCILIIIPIGIPQPACLGYSNQIEPDYRHKTINILKIDSHSRSKGVGNYAISNSATTSRIHNKIFI